MITPGLERITQLLARIPLPWRAIHVAGTNGKGSICAYISCMLDVHNDSQRRKDAPSSGVQAATQEWRKIPTGDPTFKPIRHGRFTSPHLIDRWDCITINNHPVSFQAFNAVEKRVLQRNEIENIGASEFELLTATAFEVFNDHNIDVAVIEVGMGGKLDSTNIIGIEEGIEKPDTISMDSFRPPPLVTAISRIGLDHQAFLGSTLEDIARAKAGIIKPGVPVVYDDKTNPVQVTRVFDAIAAENESPVVRERRKTTTSWTFDTEYKQWLHDILKKKDKLSDHVISNATIAFLATWTALEQLGRIPVWPLDQDEPPKDQLKLVRKLAHEMYTAVPKMIFPGRQQTLSIEILTGGIENVLLDGAHNAQSAQALAPVVEQLRLDLRRNIVWVLAASDTKDAKEILAPLLKDGDKVVAVEFGPVDGMPWVKPMSGEKVLEATRAVVENPDSLTTHNAGKDVLAGLRTANDMCKGHPIVIAGSLYLVGDVLRLLRDAQFSSTQAGVSPT